MLVNRVVDIHMGNADSTSEQFIKSVIRDEALAQRVHQYTRKDFGTHTDECLQDTIKFIQYALNSEVTLFDARNDIAYPKVLKKQPTNFLNFNFQPVHILIFSQAEIYLVLSDQLAGSVELCKDAHLAIKEEFKTQLE